MKIWRKRIGDSINQLISDKAVYRTAPATPGLIKIGQSGGASCRRVCYQNRYIFNRPGLAGAVL